MEEWPFEYVIIASKNKGKLKQFADLFGQTLHLEVRGLNDFTDVGFPEIVEDQPTFAGNARKKAKTISQTLQVPVISDDSGLVVPALHGEPGVYSARYAGLGATDEQNMQKLIQKIRSVPLSDRHGKYVCAMALAIPHTQTDVVFGECWGIILEEPRGSEGFGYDPIFYIPSEQKTFAELPAHYKYQISHRAKATSKLIKRLKRVYRFSTLESR
jgi:XTP/dITP diphosphohydrolase